MPKTHAPTPPKTEATPKPPAPLSARVALVIEGSRSHADHGALTALGQALASAQLDVQVFRHGLGQLARLHLRRKLVEFAPDLFLVSGATSLRDVQPLAQKQGKPLVACYWPQGVIHNLHVGFGAPLAKFPLPSFAIVGPPQDHTSFAQLAQLPRERIHTFPVPKDGQPPSLQTLQDLVRLICELLAAQSPVSPSVRLVRASYARVLPWLAQKKAVSLAYHRVVPKLRGPDLNLVVSAGVFEQQIRALLHKGYRPLTQASQAAELRSGRAKDPSFAVTFDDGYLDTLEVAAPILHSLGVPFTVYVITGLLDKTLPLPWYEVFQQALCAPETALQALFVLRTHDVLRQNPALDAPVPPIVRLPFLLAALKTLPHADRTALASHLFAEVGPALLASPLAPKYLDAQHVLRLREMGAEISSHTCQHPLLPALDDAELQAELANSRAALTALCGSCPGLAYPNGDTDDRVARFTKEAGYDYAVCIVPKTGTTSPFHLPRHMIFEHFALTPKNRFDEPLFLAKLLR